jgi:phosphatidylserine decarboxylase
MSIKQGQKYDSPESVRDILPFIEFHKLNTDELLQPVDSFSELSLATREQ